MNILVINAGSSSIKTVLYRQDGESLVRVLSCSAINIGQERASIDVTKDDTPISTPTPLSNHTDALSAIMSALGGLVADIGVVAHRIVYGGEKYFQPTDITDEVVTDLMALSDFDPQHAPLSLAIITALRTQQPTLRQVACFDTSYFHDIPQLAQVIPIPKKYRDAGIRRYGYHGLSYQYLSDTFGELAGEGARRGRVIYAHLGSGSSMAATLNGVPIDMTMGLTPTSGLMMGSRTGDVDPSLAWVLAKKTGLSLDDYQRMINQESGLLAVSEVSTDMYTLLQQQASNPQAALAVELFCYQARKAIGSLAATIGGLDSLIFSGGMGEQSAEIRRRICEGLEFLGITIDSAANERHDRLISSLDSKAGVHVLPTDESISIARSITQTKTTKG